MVSTNYRINLPVRHDPGFDLRYQNDANFRMSEAERYVRLAGTGELSQSDVLFIPHFCSYEIQKVRAWNSLSSFERCLYKIADAFFSKLPNNNTSAVKIFGSSMIATGAILYGAYVNQPKIVLAAALGMIAMIGNEIHFEKTASLRNLNNRHLG